MKKSISNAEHYIWGNNCDGWHLAKTDSLSVIQERMPSGTSEQYHFHRKAQQVFYILEGTATFIIEGNTQIVNSGESLHVPILQKHKISNEGDCDLHFIVVSEPKSHGDRENVGL